MSATFPAIKLPRSSVQDIAAQISDWAAPTARRTFFLSKASNCLERAAELARTDLALNGVAADFRVALPNISRIGFGGESRLGVDSDDRAAG
ncbi:hypothetical protein [Chelativorans intermedius]|uniref:Uncharacterized protein n=1 Tax=Chelativorans intermedius TaxID=515947 RepID=A0ABV6DBY9_9HYPH|nr:hypothetical protein [Chelativorans intermedius]MCT9000299.1 hypothetical protein [Chelativorans intermedius]